jgi:serine/threonine-protein kinase
VLFQMTRAVIVPSTVRRTILVCVVSALPLLGMTWLLAVRAPDAWSSGRTGYAPLYVALWCLESAIPAALASSVIYGLRQQVRRASQLGQYTLEGRLGEGGMGTVYRARHAMLRRPTAIKLLRPERTSEQALVRFEREVQLTSRLTHPNTVAIYDYGRTADGIFYYAMEYLDGLDLQRLVEVDGPQPAGRVVHILTQVCRALDEAHGLGLIHRDIKPANIIMCERGGQPDVAKVVDFGLVKSLTASDENPMLSSAHVIVGTPHFLAPEAIRSATGVDLRSDLYALGGVGYYLLAGEHVFGGSSVLEVCGHQLHSVPVRPSDRSGRVIPAALEDVILRCLAKDPAARPQNAAALAAELAACEIDGWSEPDARAWWASWRGRRKGKPGSPTDPDDLHLSPSLLEVDVHGRARSGSGSGSS